ncbi:hypothetical protein [Oceaniglobus trochenteri]|uniref:hypothetical protein n=1 Tax=Oceaniglobus trochenteri TaxID=2763260 RepID=UPI001CFFE55A|nr:hypothetical protein [Oceaniglobus trochenteri]
MTETNEPFHGAGTHGGETPVGGAACIRNLPFRTDSHNLFFIKLRRRRSQVAPARRPLSDGVFADPAPVPGPGNRRLATSEIERMMVPQ